jgi:hypothetical protein
MFKTFASLLSGHTSYIVRCTVSMHGYYTLLKSVERGEQEYSFHIVVIIASYSELVYRPNHTGSYNHIICGWTVHSVTTLVMLLWDCP